MNRIIRLEELLKEQPEDAFMNHALALEYIKAGEEEKAEKVFRKILSTNPDYVGSYYHLGKLLERKGDEGEAVRIYKKGMEAAKRMGDTHAYNELRAACEYLEF
ncbi:hypothetical protein A8C56_08440 [Niabella ginsenosidivorans]|uniref:Uncharacterized protein n=1 Tax=Niabella ginsenosidivorans TaxID=1176587 RepID=A0A1A9I9R3_9BACT|nr:hypothetical protein [Niabella ginsenosidivorans]ANH83799.1 hypothetical protein A8C56_08440 [Niabella ginsenosidivorans]